MLRFTVGNYAEGKEFQNTGVYGKIIGSVGKNLRIKYQVLFIDENNNLFAASSIWLRTYDPTCTFFDKNECGDNGKLSVGSKASTATSESTVSNTFVKKSIKKKMSLHKDIYIFLFISFIFSGNVNQKKLKILLKWRNKILKMTVY